MRSKIKKVLLVNPPVSIYVNKTAFLPLPLLILGRCLRAVREDGTDFAHEVIDLDLLLKRGFLNDDESFYRQSSDLILSKNPDLLLLTIHGVNHVVVLKLSEIIKRQQPSCAIVVGGVGPTLMAPLALGRCENIDIIVRGEGEPVIGPLVRTLLQKGNLSSVPSIVYRKGTAIVETEVVPLRGDFSIPFPDYSLVRVDDYIEHNKAHPYVDPGFVIVESGRGCRHGCAFCAPSKMWHRTARYRDIPEVLEEMKFLAAKGGDFTFFTQDNVEEGFLISLSEALLKEDLRIRWGCYSRLDQLHEATADLLSEAGCCLIFTGFETPNPKVQRTIRKVIDSSALFRKLQAFNAKRISFIGSFMAGFPGEKEEDVDATMRLALECAAGTEFEPLRSFVKETTQDKLPLKGANICQIHPLAYMPGTDSFSAGGSALHISRYSLQADCYGSFIFGHDQFKDDWSFLGLNPYLNHLPEEKVRFYCSVLRLFNFFNSRPYYLALLLSRFGQSPLGLMRAVAARLGDEFVLTARIEDFEAQCRSYAAEYLAFVPEWTVKKGQ